MRIKTFMDVCNIPRAGYFHGCIIRDITPHERHHIIFQRLCAGTYMVVVK